MFGHKYFKKSLWCGGLFALTSLLLPGAPGHAAEPASFQETGWVTVASNANFQGSWNTNYGTVALRVVADNVTGQYNNNGTIGDLRGTVNGPFLQGKWADNKYGKGLFQFVMNPDGRSFRGSWTQDGKNQSGEWSGWR